MEDTNVGESGTPTPSLFFSNNPCNFHPLFDPLRRKRTEQAKWGRGEKKKSVRSSEGGGGVVHSLVRFCPPCIEMRRRENTRVPGAGGTSKEGRRGRRKVAEDEILCRGEEEKEEFCILLRRGEGGEAKIIIELLANDLSPLSSFCVKRFVSSRPTSKASEMIAFF